MGSPKYPSHTEYAEYMSLNSGYENAFTQDDETNYYFEVSNQAFENGLDRLCDFFSGSLLKEECIEKEIQAVHEEFVLQMNDDSCRR